MYSSLKRALMSALIVASVAIPLAGTAAPLVVRDARQNECRLVSAPFAGHKSAYRATRYVCGDVTYSIFDPTLARSASASVVQIRQGKTAQTGQGAR